MIEIKIKEECCGCESCVQCCPKHCISFKSDNEGFFYPIADREICIVCGLCEKVCPILNPMQERMPLQVLAAKNLDNEIRLTSSSGGIFTLFAEHTIKACGVVFGARFNDKWEVVHDCTETTDGIALFRGSKYVQSRIGDVYLKAEQYLKAGREVLFSGTPCQIAGLKRFLRKEYENLTTVDFLCHGVPSPKVWNSYLKETFARKCKKIQFCISPYAKCNLLVKKIAFRDKTLGWKKFSFVLALSALSKSGEKNTVLFRESKYKNLYLRAFLRNLILRPSCYCCKFKGFSSGSDLTIADFWSINKDLPHTNDHKGHSLCFVNTERGKCIVTQCVKYSHQLDLEPIYNGNLTIKESAKQHKNRRAFFDELSNGKSVRRLIKKYATVSLRKQIHLIVAEILGN